MSWNTRCVCLWISGSAPGWAVTVLEAQDLETSSEKSDRLNSLMDIKGQSQVARALRSVETLQ